MIKVLLLFLNYQILNFLFTSEMNNPDSEIRYQSFLFVLASTTRVKSGNLKSEGDISAGLFMCYFIKLKEFATKQHRMAKSVHF